MPVGSGKALVIPLTVRTGPIHVSRRAREVPWWTGLKTQLPDGASLHGWQIRPLRL